MSNNNFSSYANAKPIGIPIVGLGSQPTQEGDEYFAFQSSPGAIPTYHMPVLPEPEQVSNLTQGKQVLAELLQALQRYQVGQAAAVIEVTHLDNANLDLVNQVLNEGEVSVLFSGTPRLQIQESVLTGVWRVQSFDAQQRLMRDWIEVADIPQVVRECAFPSASAKPLSTEQLPPDAVNAPALLTEIHDKMTTWQVGDVPHVINLTLLPLSTADIASLGERLGVGDITILSRGYGNCRIGSTQYQPVWWVKFYNSEEALILNTIEIVDVPAVAKAASEDLADSAYRLAEILQVYQ